MDFAERARRLRVRDFQNVMRDYQKKYYMVSTNVTSPTANKAIDEACNATFRYENYGLKPKPIVVEDGTLTVVTHLIACFCMDNHPRWQGCDFEIVFAHLDHLRNAELLVYTYLGRLKQMIGKRNRKKVKLLWDREAHVFVIVYYGDERTIKMHVEPKLGETAIEKLKAGLMDLPERLRYEIVRDRAEIKPIHNQQ